MLTAIQAKNLSCHRSIVAKTRTFGPTPEEQLALRYAQTGLPFTSEHAAYLTVHLTSKRDITLAKIRDIAAELETAAANDDYRWVVALGVSIDFWLDLCRDSADAADEALAVGHEELCALLQTASPPFAYTGGDLFFHIKAIEQASARAVEERIRRHLGSIIDLAKTNCTIGDSLHNGRIYGGRMLHGLIGSVDPVCFSARALIGDELPRHKGGCYGLTQCFVHDWQQLSGMADIDLENLIGRDHTGRIITTDDDRFHVKCVRVNDENGLNYRIVGESQPFRTSGGACGREDGIYQIAYAKSLDAFLKVIKGMLGDKPGYIKSRHLNVSHARLGSYWYVPSATELGLPAPHTTLTVGMNSFYDVRSGNGRMFYNSKDYLHQLGNRTEVATLLDPQPTDRIVELLGYMFSRWHDTWYRRRPSRELGHLETYLADEEKGVLSKSVAERKGYATRKTLDLLSSEPVGREYGVVRLHPKELIVGVVPEYTLGSGFEVMRYLNTKEQDLAFVLRLNEAGAAGHNVPNYRRLLAQGVGGVLDDVQERLATAKDDQRRAFYQSVVYALEGVQIYLRNHADLARRTLAAMRFGSAADRRNLAEITDRFERLAKEPPKSFLDAAQLVFSLHCCMHLTGESVSIGRLDQLLYPFYQADAITEDSAQEIIDAFWIKMDEQVLLNHRHFHDRLSRGNGAITYAGGDFPQGAALNQWVQQVTVGGCAPADGPALPSINAITRMCLRASRRLPLNAPCLSIRIGRDTPTDILQESASALLAGGGHPFLINDDKIIEGLLLSARESGTEIDLADARDMVCDGCFEAIVAGKSEFAFSFVPVPEAVEMALNRGRTYASAGPVHMSGLKASYRSEAPEEIDSFEKFYGIFLKHYRYKLLDFYVAMLSRYGNLRHACPSPLLSALVDGCVERGRDISAGGARYKILSPLMNGISTAIDALWAINDMVFSEEAVFTLQELSQALVCDWGHDLKEPFCSSTMGEDRSAVLAERFRKLRDYATGLPKFGSGHEGVDRFARRLLRDLLRTAYDIFRDSQGPVADAMKLLRAEFGDANQSFEFIISPGIATFEDYGGIGSFLGASADGRRSGQPVASDFSPSPTPIDLPVPSAGRPWSVLRSWAAGPADDDPQVIDPVGIGISNGSPVDINIHESFPEEELVRLLRAFANGTHGGSMLSVSCSDPGTLVAAQNQPDCYDLVRMRMGGWSEFFVAMFPEHQEHHKRRPSFDPDVPRSSVTGTPWMGITARTGKR